MKISNIFLCICLFCFSSCTITSTQIKMLSAMWKKEPSGPPVWVASYNSSSFQVFPLIQEGNKVVFVGRGGQQFFFEGVELYRVVGFGPNKTIELQRAPDGLLHFTVDGQRSTSIVCDRWLERKLAEGSSNSTQVCKWRDREWVNSYDSKEGDVTVISTIIHPDMDTLSFTKVP